MAGGLLQLVATGSKDAPLTYNPEITFFKLVYKRYTNFAIQQSVKNLGIKNFNTFTTYKIDRSGDLLESMYFKIIIPKFNIIKNNKTNNISGTSFNINQLDIIYNNNESYVFYYQNNFYIVPYYILKLYDFNEKNTLVQNEQIIKNLIPELIRSNNIVNNCILLDITEDSVNSILSLLRKYDNFFEDYILNIISKSTDYEYNNQLITQTSYINNLSSIINDYFYTNYNYYNNSRFNKVYYNLDEVKQYLIYKNSVDINFVTQNNYDVDVIYNYCLINNINTYLVYQTNSLLYNTIFVYNILLQLYPPDFTTFTFWKKYSLLANNVPNQSYNINTYNRFGEWTSNLNDTFNQLLLTTSLQLTEIYNRNYSIAQNNINQLFNLLTISNPSQLFIILSTFINQYDNTNSKINFDDYNSLTNTNLLEDKINQQLNKYSTLVTSNSVIYAIPNLDKILSIYPIDLMVIYSYLAYKLTENIVSQLIFKDNLFIVYWRNKINTYFFLNYHQSDSININNSDLYDTNELNRNLTFYANFNIRNLMLLSDIKKYFLELFYCSSFFGCVNFTNQQFSSFLSTLNTISITQLQVNNSPIELTESIIKSYNNLKIETEYIISNYNINLYIVTIPNWTNNFKENTSYTIKYNSISYKITSFTNINFILTLNFEYLPNINENFTLIETNQVDLPLVKFDPLIMNVNNYSSINIFKKENNIILTDNILSENIFELNKSFIEIDTVINNYVYYFTIASITINNKVERYQISIESTQGRYQITTNDNITLNKNNITNIDIEFIDITYSDITTIDANTIINNRFKITNRNDWVYNPLKTYWLVHNENYIALRFSNDYFIINDTLELVIYTVREIDNSSFPSFYNFLNIASNYSSPSDLMDFTFQTPMIFLANTLEAKPYIYFYNIPFLISINSSIYLNETLVNYILPLNSNQFFGKTTYTSYSDENLNYNIDHFSLINLMNNSFNSIYDDPQYISIINTLEQAKKTLTDLNINALTNTRNYGNTTSKILSNIVNINSRDLLNFNNEDYNQYNKLAIDLYGNNNTLISNSVIQGLVVNIYNIPILSYLPNRKISTDLINYLENIPAYFQEQINYIENNNDFVLLSNSNQYLELYSSLNDINSIVQTNTYDYGNSYQLEMLYPLENNNLSSIYYNNQQIDISNLVTNNFNQIINNDDQFKTEIISSEPNVFETNRFNYFGGIYLDSSLNINFENIITDISSYNYIQLDNTKVYDLNLLNSNTITTNIIHNNASLIKFIDTSANITYNYLNIVYYYKIKIDIGNQSIAEIGNCFYNNNHFYYFDIFDINNNIIEIISLYELDLYEKNYLTGFIIITSLDDIFNSSYNKILGPTSLFINSMIFVETYTFNYYNNENIIKNNIIINNIYQPIIKKINAYNFLNYDSSSSIISFTIVNKFNNKKLPPIQIINSSIVSSVANEQLYREKSQNAYIKLNNYIININNLNNNILSAGNYELSLLPLSKLNLFTVDISGSLSIRNNQITITFNNIINTPRYCYYLINNSFVYLENIDYEIILTDNNTKYYVPGIFSNIYLLDNLYFKNVYPNIVNYQYSLLGQDLIGNITISGGIIPDIDNLNLVIDSLFNNKPNDIIEYTNTNILVNSKDEYKIELNLYDNDTNKYFLRPVIIKNSIGATVPISNFSWINSSIIYNNSYIILKSIPAITVNFLTITLSFSNPIISVVSLNPSISINSNTNFTSNLISFNDTTGLIFNKNYLWKILVNNEYPLYFWTYFSSTNTIYTTNSVSEPIYINQNNLTLFKLNNNILLLGSLPNYVITNNNNVILLNNNLFYHYFNRKLSNKYYIYTLYNNTNNYEILPLNYHISKKYEPVLFMLDKSIITEYDKNIIYLDQASIDILTNTSYLLIQNDKLYYTTIVKTISGGIYVDNINLNNSYPITIYYSYSKLVFNNNNIVISDDLIISYQYNDFINDELIYVNDNIFKVIGLNSFTKFYELMLVSGSFKNINYKINGYYSMGVYNKKPMFKYPKISYTDPLIYTLDADLKIGDYYFKNNIFQPKIDMQLVNDVFVYKKNGVQLELFVNNNNFYCFNDFININNNDILVYNQNIYHVKTIINKQVYFNELLILNDGIYSFYYPYQPFNYNYIKINNDTSYDFIELYGTFYQNIPPQYYNLELYTRIVNIQKTKFFFDNQILLNNYINNISLDDTATITINSTIIDTYTIDLINNDILNFNFYYMQPIKINSIINFINDVNYRDTTIIIQVVNPLIISSLNIKITFCPLIINLTKYYSKYEMNNFNSNNIVSYQVINKSLLNINTKLDNPIPNTINLIDNYVQIDLNKQIIPSSLKIGSYHTILEITESNDTICHLVQIQYPHNLYFYTLSLVVNNTSDYFLDKIYKIKINFIDFSFVFDNNYFYKKTQLLYKINTVDVWYKYPIKINGVPIYNNNRFELEILDANQFVNYNIYLSENATIYYIIEIIDNKFYLISDTYLGNNITYIYLKNVNYIKKSYPIVKNFKQNLTNHSDTKLLNYINTSYIVPDEKIPIPVIVTLITSGDYYKYIILTTQNTQYLLNQNTNYAIGDVTVLISQHYIYQDSTFIFTKSQIPNIDNNQTKLFVLNQMTTEYFNQISLFKTVPEILSKINLDHELKQYMIINSLKTWPTWSVLSAINIDVINQLVNKGALIYNNNQVSQNNSNVYFTNSEVDYLSKLLVFINTDTNELNKINIQLNLLNSILLQLPYWINDSTFWLNVSDRINLFLIDLNIDATFNGSCLVFNDEVNKTDIYFDTDITTRKYTLNNQYILIDSSQITRDMNLINMEIDNLVFNNINNSVYGIEINELLKKLNEYGSYYIKINNEVFSTENKKYNYFTSLKLFINHIWNNYKTSLNQLNPNFNTNLILTNTIDTTTKKIINYFTTNFTYKSSKVNIIDEIYISNYEIIDTNYYAQQQTNLQLKSDPIYPYSIILSNDIIIPQVVYQLNFYNISYESVLFDLNEYPVELNFYLNNDLDTTVNYSIVGLNKYDASSNYLGKLYSIPISDIDSSMIDYVNYKGENVFIYNYDISNINIASPVNIESNNTLELYKNVGIKYQINNYLIFYQNNFNYVQNSTYINYQTIFYPLYVDISGNYFITSNITFPQSVTLIILLNINKVINQNQYIYKLLLSTQFLNYNDYINSSQNIIPVNFLLNNQYIPNDVIFYTDTDLVVNSPNQININNISHYANIGETVPVQIQYIIKQNSYLYTTNETFNLLPNSTIRISDTSNYIIGDIGLIDNLSLVPIQFILNILYSEEELLLKHMTIESSWVISNYIFNPNNNNLIFDYPQNLMFKNTINYYYTIDGLILDKTQIYVKNNKLIATVNQTISGSFIFIQVFTSLSPIFKNNLNQIAKVKLLNEIQYSNDLYFLPLDQYGNNMGLYLYKVTLQVPVIPFNILVIDLIGDDIYPVNLLLWNSQYEIIISTNTVLTNQDYKINFNNLNINVSSLEFYQKSYIDGKFYYQSDIESFYIFVNENCNSFDFTYQLNKSRYYIHSYVTTTELQNIFNPRTITRSSSMKPIITKTVQTDQIIEKPIINVNKIFQYISFYIGDQLVETLNEDIYNVFFNCYASEEKRYQSMKLMKLRENDNEWELYFPLLFWFYNQSTIALPLIALPYTDLFIKFQINSLGNILSNDITNSSFSTLPTIKIEVGLDTILLDINERLLFGSYQHEYVIERFVSYPNQLIHNQRQTVNLRFNNLVKDIFWISKPIYHPNETAYTNKIKIYDTKYNYYVNTLNYYIEFQKNPIITEQNISYINDFNIIESNNKEIIIDNTLRLNIINNDKLLNKYDIHFTLFLLDKYLSNLDLQIQINKLKLYYIYLYKNEIKISEYSPISTLNIQSNAVDLIPTYNYNYFNSVIPYTKFLNSPPVGYYAATFSLFPYDKQPSGHLNFNHLDNVVLNITADPNVTNEPFNLSTVVKEYQILRIMSGLGSLAWTN